MIRTHPANKAYRSGWDKTFRTSKQRYDERRRSSAMRACREIARSRMRKIPKTGQCEKCWDEGKTVWHHLDCGGRSLNCVELCYTCHRAEHPRPMPQGGTA